MSGSTEQATLHLIPQDLNPQENCCGKLKSCIIVIFMHYYHLHPLMHMSSFFWNSLQALVI